MKSVNAILGCGDLDAVDQLVEHARRSGSLPRTGGRPDVRCQAPLTGPDPGEPSELGLLPAARIAAELGIAGLSPEVVERTRDKHSMRGWLRAKGFSTVPSAVVSDAKEIRDFAAEHGYPVIVKPRHGPGSEYVACMRSAETVVSPSAIADEYVVEPFLEGPEFSVEAVSCAGVHHVIAITGKLTQDDDPDHPFVEIGHVVPAPIAPPAAAAITRYVGEFLDAMEITDGVSHTEVRLTSAGPEVIETHTRVGGDSIPTLVRQATGHDLLDHLVGWTLDGVHPWVGTRGAGAAAIRFFTHHRGGSSISASAAVARTARRAETSPSAERR